MSPSDRAGSGANLLSIATTKKQIHFTRFPWGSNGAEVAFRGREKIDAMSSCDRARELE
ncbi:MAG TPA: hypothetical protein V6D16_00240 [Candidatus Obscuribacterales bacterium]